MSSDTTCEKAASNPLMEVCMKMAGFLKEQHRRRQAGENLHESCTEMTNGALRVVRSLECGTDLGIDLIATSVIPRTVTMQISCDPARFRRWKEHAQCISHLDASILGFRLVFDGQHWSLIDHNRSLYLETDCKDPYELGRFLIEGRRVYRMFSPTDLPKESRVLPGFEQEARLPDNQSSRLLEELG